MPGLSLRGYEFNRLLRGGAETGGAVGNLFSRLGKLYDSRSTAIERRQLTETLYS